MPSEGEILFRSETSGLVAGTSTSDVTKSAEFSDARGEKFNTCFMFIMSQPCNFLRGPGPVWRCVRTERASILTRTWAGLELRKGGSKSLLSLPEPGPVWPCVGTVAKCVRLVANQKVSILRRFATILTPLRAGLAVGRDSRDLLPPLRRRNHRVPCVNLPLA